jgi:DNA-binding PadR family transcriptional regulator
MAMIDIAILGLLKEHDLHGYELRKRLDELPGSRPAVSFGSLYPALNRLERAGHVKAVTHETSPTPAAPMSGSLAGELAAFRAHRASAARSDRGSRGKKVFGLTDTGDRRLHELLVDPDVADDRAFEARVAFCHHLGTAERVTLFEARRAELVRRREQVRRSQGANGGVTPYVRSLYERDAAAITADLAWLDELVKRETAGGADGRPADPAAAAGPGSAGNRRENA